MAISGRFRIARRSEAPDPTAPPPPPAVFTPGTTEPYIANPLAPSSSDNVGWDGTDFEVLGDRTQDTLQMVNVEPGQVLANRVIWANVTLQSAESRLENCIIYGGKAATNRAGLVLAPNGGQLSRCTIFGMPKSVAYYTNGIKMTGGGVLDVERSVIMRTVDAIHVSGSNAAQVIDTGNFGDRFAFFDNDLDHASGTPAYWTHNDWLQALTASNLEHRVLGTKVNSYFDTTGVAWSGGAWGSGTASGGEIGMPSTALNAGYWSTLGRGTWCNGMTFSNQTGHRARIEKCWIDGVNATSGMIQFTVGTGNLPVLLGNRFGLGGRPSRSGVIYLVSYPTGTVATIGSGADVNVYADMESVPLSLRGQPLTWTAGGAKIDTDTF